MHCLRIVKSRCEDCGECERILPKFKTVHEGHLLISDNKADSEEVKEAVYLVQMNCLSNALIFEQT